MSMTSTSPGRTKKIINISLLSVLFLFVIITLYISFSNYFKGNTAGFIICPSSAVTNSDFGSTIVLRKVSDDSPIQNATITAELQDSSGFSLCKVSSKTNLSGSVFFTLKIPEQALGPLTFSCKSSTTSGKFSFKKTIPLKENLNIKIIAAKQEYLPGESVLFKILLSQNSLPFQGELSVKFLDPENNQLFLSSGKTSEFGICSGEIPLGENITPGLYKLIVESSISKAVKTVKISQFSPSALEMNALTVRNYFSPGIKNTVKFFVEDNLGVRVPKTQINAKVYEIIDGDKNIGKQFSGFTDSQGVFSFTYTPEEYSSNFLSDKSSEILIEAKAQKSGNIETDFSQNFYFSDKPFYVYIFPECKELVAGVTNRIFLLTADPQGKGIRTDVSITLKENKINLKTDEHGFAFFEMDPSLESGFVPFINAKDIHGNSAETILDIPSLLSSHTFSASADKVILMAGEDITVNLRALSEENIYYLFLRSGEQILLNREIHLKNRYGKDVFRIPSAAHGICDLSIVSINKGGELEKTSLPIYVFPNIPLSFAINTDKNVYYPGEQGKILFNLLSDNSRISSIIAGIAQAPTRLSVSKNADSLSLPVLSLMTSDMGEFSFPLSSDIQNRARVALSSLDNLNTGSELYFEDVYKFSLKQGYERKIEYYRQIFSYSLKIALIICLVSFLLSCILVLFRFFAVSSLSVHPLKMESFEELAPLILFNISVPFIILISSFCTVFLLVLKKISLSNLFFSESVLWPSLTALILLFGFALTLKRIIDTFRAVKISSSLLWSVRLILTYTVSLIVIILILMFSSRGPLSFLNLSVVLYDNLNLCLMAGLSFIIIPFIIVALSLAYFTSKPSKIVYKSAFYIFIVLFLALFILSTVNVLKGTFPLQARVTERLNLLKIPINTIDSDVGKENEGELIEAFFPQGKTFAFDSSILTDKSGMADMDFTVPRVSGEMTAKAIAFTKNGESFPISTDFLVERPVSLSFPLPGYAYMNDEIIVPLQIYNNSDSIQNMTLSIASGDGLMLKGFKDKKISLAQGKTFSENISFKVIGEDGGINKVVLSLKTPGFKENIAKYITLKRSGFENDFLYSGMVEGGNFTFKIPKEALNSQSNTISVETGYLAMLINQNSSLKNYISSSSYYSIYSLKIKSLVLKRLRALKQNESPIYRQIEKELIRDYQNLLVYKTQDDLFSLFKDSTPDLFLSSVALESLVSASEIISVDSFVVEKISRAILNMQKQNGSWNNKLAISAKAVSALSMAGYSKNKMVKKGIDYLEKNYLTENDPYTLGLIAKLFYGRDKELFNKIVALLNKNLLFTEGTCHWETKSGVWHGAEGIETQLEATAIALSALLQHKDYDDPGREALNFLMKNRDKYGGWYSLAGTYEVLDMLALIFENNSNDEAMGALNLNGSTFEFPIIPNSTETISLKVPENLLTQDNNISWNIPSEYNGAYMIKLPYNSDTNLKSDISLKGLILNSSCSKSYLKEGETILNYITVLNTMEKELYNFVVEIPIPSGFSFVSHSLSNDKNLQKFELCGDKIKLYFKHLSKNGSQNVSVRFICLQKGSLSLENTSVYILFNSFMRVYSGKKELKIKE